MSLLTPFGLLALLGVPAILYLHLFRRRLRQRDVAGLFLWAPERLAAAAGRKRARLQNTASLWLECLGAVLLALWLGGLTFGGGERASHLVAVLDDSASMAAHGGDGSTRDRAAGALREVTAQLPRGSVVTLLTTGARPEILLGPRAPRALLDQGLDRWRPRAPGHDAAAALDLAAELAGDDGEVQFLTDDTLTGPVPGCTVRGFGNGLPNAAILAARRTRSGDRERLEVELRAFADTPIDVELRVASGESTLARRPLALPNVRPLRIALELPATDLPLRIELPPDALAIDDRVWLLPEPIREVAVAQLFDTGHRRQLELDRALAVLPQASLVEDPSRAQVLLSPAAGALHGGITEVVVGAPGEERDAWLGPFLLDRAHPLLQGMTLDGVVWSAGRSALPGRTLVSVGDQALLAEEDLSSGRRLWLNLDPARSNLTTSPDWPILLSNLVERARSELPGPTAVHVSVGEVLGFRLAAAVPEAERPVLVDPEGTERVGRGLRVLTWAARMPGIHRLRAPDGGELGAFAVHFDDPRESDLRGCRTFTQAAEPGDAPVGGGVDEPILPRILVLLLLACLCADWWVLRAGGGQ